MSSCVNGRFHADACRCYKFWTGRACDKRLCARGAGILRPDDGLCRCRAGFGGEFCQYEICRHQHQWYCNTTEMAPRTIWDRDEETKPPELCAKNILDNWFRPPEIITPTWYCHCGNGYRQTLTNSTEIMNAFCTCQGGHFGSFCENNICTMNGSVWEAKNNSCGLPVKIDDNIKGYFGYDINNELTVVATAIFILIILFMFLGRWYLWKLEKVDETDTVARRMARRSYNQKSKKKSSTSFGYEGYESMSLGSLKSSDWSMEPIKRKQGNLSPTTLPVRNYNYKDFYEAVPQVEPEAKV